MELVSVSDIVTSAGLGFYQYADDTQIYFAMRHATASQDIDTLRICTERLRCWFLNNGLMLNPDKSEALLVGTRQQRQAVAVVGAVSVAGVDLPLSSELKSLGVIIDEQLSFESHIEPCAAHATSIYGRWHTSDICCHSVSHRR